MNVIRFAVTCLVPTFLKAPPTHDFARSSRCSATGVPYFCTIAALVLVCVGAVDAKACPLIDGLPDYNCDGKVQVVVVGDSLVSGIGDTKNANSGGYVVRTQKQFPSAAILSHGVPGLRTQVLLKRLRKALAAPATEQLGTDIVGADVVVLDVGRNDRWNFGLPEATLRNLKRARELIEASVESQVGYSPLVVTAVLMLPNRGSQGPWVKELNGLILQSHSEEAPADLRFDLVSKRLLASDNVHPTSKGYAAIAKVFGDYLMNEYRQHVVALREDLDADGLYDIFERVRYGTDPKKPDTDGDGIKDGQDPQPTGAS